MTRLKMYELFDWRMTISRVAWVTLPPSAPWYVVSPIVPVASDAQCIAPSSSQVTGLPAQDPAVAPPLLASDPVPPLPPAPSCPPVVVDGDFEGLLEHPSDKEASDRSAAVRRMFEGAVAAATGASCRGPWRHATRPAQALEGARLQASSGSGGSRPSSAVGYGGACLSIATSRLLVRVRMRFRSPPSLESWA